ncbi:MAG: hypothetical protein ABSF84_02765 [Acidimicrobiales bacterium]|jgi:hypothetical protein
MTMSVPAIPSWEWTELQQLGAAGDLFGVSPEILGSIDQAESSGDPGSANSSGYGGFFGLGAGTQYPGGSVPASQMGIDTPAELAFEAPVAASAFNSYLAEAGGNVTDAEEIYQSGSASGPTEGSEILDANLGGTSTTAAPSSSTSGTGTAQTDSLNWNPLDLFGIPGSVGDAVTAAVLPFLAKAMLVLAGVGILIVAAYKAASPSVKNAVDEAGPAAALA